MIVTVEPDRALVAGVVPTMAPVATVELYVAASGGQTPTRWTAASAPMASVQLENVVRFGMVTSGGPVDTTTAIAEPCLSVVC